MGWKTDAKPEMGQMWEKNWKTAPSLIWAKNGMEMEEKRGKKREVRKRKGLAEGVWSTNIVPENCCVLLLPPLRVHRKRA